MAHCLAEDLRGLQVVHCLWSEMTHSYSYLHTKHSCQFLPNLAWVRLGIDLWPSKHIIVALGYCFVICLPWIHLELWATCSHQDQTDPSLHRLLQKVTLWGGGSILAHTYIRHHIRIAAKVEWHKNSLVHQKPNSYKLFLILEVILGCSPSRALPWPSTDCVSCRQVLKGAKNKITWRSTVPSVTSKRKTSRIDQLGSF